MFLKIKMINYLEILKETNQLYSDLSLDEIKNKLNAPINKIVLINNIKNFIFKHNYKPTFELVYKYLKYLTSKKDLNQALLIIFNIKNNFKYENFMDLTNYILQKLKNIIYITINDNTKIDYSDITNDLNNFHINYANKEQTQSICKLEECHLTKKKKYVFVKETENCIIYTIKYNNKKDKLKFELKDLKQDLDPDLRKKLHEAEVKPDSESESDSESEPDSENEEIYETEKEEESGTDEEDYENHYINKKTYIQKIYYKDSKVLFNKFSLPYKKKTIPDFEYNKKTFNNNLLTLANKINLYTKISDYEYLISKLRNYYKCKYNIYTCCKYSYKIDSDKIYHYSLSVQDSELDYNCNIVYQYIKEKLKNENIFYNFEFSQIKEKLPSIIYDNHNTVFYIFDLCKAFYNTRLDYMYDIIKEHLVKINNEELFQFEILFNYISIIKNSVPNLKYLPITKYSGILFKLYFKILFSSIDFKNYLIYVDDFIIYGTKEEVDNTFQAIEKILYKHKFSLSTFTIVDKIFHNELTFLQQKFEFPKNNLDIISKCDKLNKPIKIDFTTNLMNNDKLNPKFNPIISKMLNIEINSKLKIDNIKFTYIPSNGDICSICDIDKKNQCLVPCGHIICAACEKKISGKKCPYCNDYYNKVIKIFYN